MLSAAIHTTGDQKMLGHVEDGIHSESNYFHQPVLKTLGFCALYYFSVAKSEDFYHMNLSS